MRPLRVFLVSAYLLSAGLWLILTRQIEAPNLGKLSGRATRPRYNAALSQVTRETGFCWTAPMPAFLLSDKESASSLALYENGVAIGPAHAGHDEIRKRGLGRYSHWGEMLYFSTPDNSDPSTNGRRYHVEEK
jgi:pectate lyase